MDRLEASIWNAEEAARLKSSPMFERAFDDTRKAIMESWAQLEPGDKDRQTELLLMVKCLDRVKRCIEVHIDTGKLANKELEGRKKRLFAFGRTA
ncbi:MAG: hypothetical protein ACRCYS_11780 [Beijerinckiaceae bacterium]